MSRTVLNRRPRCTPLWNVYLLQRKGLRPMTVNQLHDPPDLDDTRVSILDGPHGDDDHADPLVLAWRSAARRLGQALDALGGATAAPRGVRGLPRAGRPGPTPLSTVPRAGRGLPAARPRRAAPTRRLPRPERQPALQVARRLHARDARERRVVPAEHLVREEEQEEGPAASPAGTARS